MEHPVTPPLPPLTLEDRYAIESLYARYNQAVDVGNVDAWMSVFAEHATFLGGGVRLCGRTELRRFAEGEAQRMAARGYTRMQHWTANLLIEGDGHSARGRCYLILVQQPEDRPSKCDFHIANYEDSFEKTDGRWYFVERKLHWWTHPPVRRSFVQRCKRLLGRIRDKAGSLVRAAKE